MISEFGFHPSRTHKYAVWMPGYRSRTGLWYILQLSCLCSFKNKATGKSCPSWIILHLTSSDSSNHVGIQIRMTGCSLLQSVQFSHSVVSNSLWLHGLKHTGLPCPSPSPSACLNSCPLSQWCHPRVSVILCHSLLLLPSIFSSISVFSNESRLRIRWPNYWSFSFSISPSNEYSGLSPFRIDWFDLLAVQGTLKSLFKHHS